MIEQKILISGLPDSGKTTFIAALWYFIFNGSIKDDYSADTLADSELEYLNTICGNWAACEKVIRTNQATLEDVTINMVHNSTGKRISLNVPDIRGEQFNRQFEFRQWAEDFENVLDGVGGLLLFVDPRDTKNCPRLIHKENQLYRIFGETSPEKSPDEAVTWSEELVPNQVKLVDFLQTLDYHRPNMIKKIAVIVSCWDVVSSEISAEEWCKINVPLLHQYLLANDGKYLSKYYGLSAQGGSYDDLEEKGRLLENPNPLDRIKVIHDVNLPNYNILSPILWLTNDNSD